MASHLGSSVRLVVMALLAFMLAIASARPASMRILPRSAPKPPSEDPFYQPPAGYESEEHGAILRQREISVAFLGLIPDPVKAYQLLYRTTAINGTAIAGVTTIFVPLGAKKDRFLSFHTAYDSSATICNPSYNYQLGAAQTDIISSAEQLILQAYLLLGYIVTSPDYEGPDAAFGPGHLEGMGVLDSMRAVSSFETLGLTSAKPMIVGAGYSGGAIATGWAASLQPTYAPELDIKGWVQGGTPANLTGTLVFIDNTLFSGFIPAAVAGIAMPSAYGAELNPIINKILTAKGAQALATARTTCAVGDLIAFPEMSLLSTEIQSLGDRLLYQPTVQQVLSKNMLGVNKTEIPTAPVFVYHATQDEVIPYSNASTMVNSWCNNGVSVKFTTFATGGHATTEVVALPDAINFVEAAFAGTTASGCSTNTELGSILNPIALGVELEPILTKLIDVLAHLGQGDSNVKQNLGVLKKVVTW
jgi:pimeloyl-ACP methyl ester carboxylesterase